MKISLRKKILIQAPLKIGPLVLIIIRADYRNTDFLLLIQCPLVSIQQQLAKLARKTFYAKLYLPVCKLRRLQPLSESLSLSFARDHPIVFKVENTT